MTRTKTTMATVIEITFNGQMFSSTCEKSTGEKLNDKEVAEWVTRVREDIEQEIIEDCLDKQADHGWSTEKRMNTERKLVERLMKTKPVITYHEQVYESVQKFQPQIVDHMGDVYYKGMLNKNTSLNYWAETVTKKLYSDAMERIKSEHPEVATTLEWHIQPVESWEQVAGVKGNKLILSK